jgi:hypothetical protein
MLLQLTKNFTNTPQAKTLVAWGLATPLLLGENKPGQNLRLLLGFSCPPPRSWPRNPKEVSLIIYGPIEYTLYNYTLVPFEVVLDTDLGFFLLRNCMLDLFLPFFSFTKLHACLFSNSA